MVYDVNFYKLSNVLQFVIQRLLSKVFRTPYARVPIPKFVTEERVSLLGGCNTLRSNPRSLDGSRFSFKGLVV